MAHRNKRGIINTEDILLSLAKGRSGAIQVCTEASIGSEQHTKRNR